MDLRQACRHESGASGAELTKVMVSVQVRPAEPCGLRHPAKNRMRRPGETLVTCCDGFEERLELSDVRGKLDGFGSPNLLIDFRTRRNSGWPPDRQVQRDPLHQRSLQKAAGIACSSLTDCNPARVAEMADHLVRRHLSPAPGALRAQGSQPANDLRLVFPPCESFHTRLILAEGLCPRTPRHALSRAASSARSVRVAHSLPLVRYPVSRVPVCEIRQTV